jgi:hypothetical protein
MRVVIVFLHLLKRWRGPSTPLGCAELRRLRGIAADIYRSEERTATPDVIFTICEKLLVATGLSLKFLAHSEIGTRRAF